MKKINAPLIQNLRFEKMTYAYEHDAPLFENVDFAWPMNQVVWLHSPSGQGRSSLLQILAGLLTPQSGQYFINESDVTDFSFEEFLPYRLKIGYGFDFGGLLNNRTIFENLILPISYHRALPPDEAQERVDGYLELMGLTKYRDQRPAVVPGGVRKLACMVRALVLHPELLLLDDPSVGLKEDVVLKYFDLVRRIQKEGAVQHLFVSSFDNKLARILDAKEVIIDEKRLFLHEPEEKLVVNG